MTRSNLTIAEHMRAVLLEAGRVAVTRDDVDLLNKCVQRCTHTSLVDVSQTEQGRRIFLALESSSLYWKEIVQRPGTRFRISKYQLIETIDDR